jgi:hypothetical protein
MFTMARMWGDSKKIPSKPEEFWPLPGDEVTRISDDEIKQLLKAVHGRQS